MGHRTNRMIRVLLASALLCCGAAGAEVPAKLGYQGYLLSAANQPVTATLQMVFRLYTVPAGGAEIYNETQTVVVTNGVFNAIIGSVNPLTADFRVPYYIGVAVGADAEMVPRQPLLSSPYALQAAAAFALTHDATVAGAQIAGAITGATLPTTALTGTVATAQIASNAVTQAKLSPTTGATAGKILGTDGTNLQWLSAGAGTLTSVATGAGLTGGPITGSGTVSVAAGGITTAEIAANAVTTTRLADGSVTDAKIVALAASKLTGAIALANGGTGLGASGPVGNVLRSTGSVWASAALQAADISDLSSRFLASDNNGNVGIGVASPLAKLHVLSGTAQSPPRLESAGSGGGFTAGWDFYHGTTGKAYIGVPDSGAGIAPGQLVVYGGPQVTKTSIWAGGVQGISMGSDGWVAIGLPNALDGRLHVENGGNTAIYGHGTSGRGVHGESGSWHGVYGRSSSNSGVVGESSTFHGMFGISHSANNAGVYGTNDTNGFGVAGVSGGGRGVDGLSTSSIGVAGKSTSGSGVYGESAAASLTAAGVYGKGTATGSIGVIGEANGTNATGVFGVSASADGFGVYARNPAGGRALLVEGNAAQTLSAGGLVKAMAYVEENGTISRCYNSQVSGSAASTAPCGLIATRSCLFSQCRTYIEFPFKVDDRFWSATIRTGGSPNINRGINADPAGATVLAITMFKTGEQIASDFFAPFMLILY